MRYDSGHGDQHLNGDIMKIHALALTMIGSALMAVTASAQTQAQGVSQNELLLGSVVDLSGPIAGYGKQTRNGLMMRLDEANEAGGINGRKFKLLVEDSGYDPKRAVMAVQKLVTRDKVFAILSHMGTAQNIAALPVQLEKNVINFFPFSGVPEMYEPPNPLKFAFFSPYYDQISTAAPRLMKERGLKRPCIIYQDDEFGHEVLKGTEDGLKAAGLPQLAATTSYKRGATDFSSQVARMSAEKCDLVVLGTIIRETVGTVNEARKIGFNPVFVGANTIYTELIPKLGGAAMDGIYATSTAQFPYADDASPAVRDWVARFKAKFNEDPNIFSVYGYYIADSFLIGVKAAGRDLTPASFDKAMISNGIPKDMFGSPQGKFAADKRLSSKLSRLSQLKNGRWQVVSDYEAFNAQK